MNQFNITPSIASYDDRFKYLSLEEQKSKAAGGHKGPKVYEGQKNKVARPQR